MRVINGNSYAPDYLTGTRYSDLIRGWGGSDVLFGYAGNDSILGGDGNDYIDGGDGNDKLYGEYGYDVIFGGNGNDYIDGGDKSDRLYGGYGNDSMKGGDGNDLLSGLYGNDIMVGGSGSDSYTDFSRYTGHDTISDCNFSMSDTNNTADNVYLNNFLSDSVKYRILDTNHDSTVDALKIYFASGSDLTIWNYFAGDGTINPGIDSNINFHFADAIFNYYDIIEHLGNIPV